MTSSLIDTRTFRRLLLRNIALPLVMTILLCTVFAGLILNMMKTNEDLVDSSQVLRGLNRSYRLVIDGETALRGFLLTGSEPFLDPRKRARDELPKELAQLRVFAADQPYLLGHIEKLSSLFTLWDTEAQTAIKQRRGLPTRDQVTAGASTRKVHMDAIRSEFSTAIRVAEQEREDRNRATTANTRMTLLAAIGAGLFFGGLIAFMGRKQLLELSHSYENVLAKQAEQNEQLAKQAWIRSGQFTLADLLRGDYTTAQVAERALRCMVETLDAEIGAFFVRSDKDFLDRAASLGLSPGAPMRFGPGEGLVGRAVEERKTLQFEDLPSEGLRIASGIVDTNPRHVLVSPLTADGRVEGVLELAFLTAPAPRVLEFLEGAQELIGVVLRSAAYRTRLQDLLHESQQLTEELQTQQEELRVSNEELAERTSALQESQVRMEAQHSELEQTNEQLEEQAQLLEHQRQDLDERNSALENARETLQKKAEELELAGRYKSEFLANMSHELRTPLNSSLILAKLLQDNPDGNLTDEQVHFASTIYDAGNDLLNLINDILDLSKVEAGKLELNRETISPREVAQGLDRLFRPSAIERHIGFEVQIDPDASSIVTDRQRLDQILRNLLSNALKFTPKGSVSLRIRADGADHVAFEVTDTGIGIDSAQHSLIFDAFHQADGTISRKFGGTGLGLSISRSLTHLLGGSLTLKSKKGEGSTFSLRLPRTPESRQEKVASVEARPETPRLPPASRLSEIKSKDGTVEKTPSDTRLGLIDDRDSIDPKKDRRILLVVEDEREFARILLNLGREEGFKVLLASTTTNGLELALQYVPTIIILDIKLPDASGLTLLNQLKENPATRHIPVHGMSSLDYTQAAMNMGAIGHLVKPAALGELRTVLAKLEAKSNQRQKRVLHVEDDPVQRSSVEKLIGNPDVQIIGVKNGESALQALKKGHFDCMIVDLKLPDMTGFELLENIADQGLHASPPVIVYTGRDLTRAEEDRLQLYSKSIIIKGARSPERLLDEVTLFLHKHEASLSPEAQSLLRTSRNRERTFDGRTIMIVDDDVRNIFALRSALEAKGAKTLIARNGREALDKIRDAEAAAAVPALVLMDIMMPEMDGYEAIRNIRANEKLKNLPIIAVTAKAMRDDYERCLKAGANDYLAKPVDLEKLISLMRVWLPRQIGRPDGP